MKGIRPLWNWLSQFWKSATAKSGSSIHIEWTRNTLLRQGNVLPVEVVRDLGFKIDGYSGEPLAVVISHNCDLVTGPQDEPYVEIVLGRPIASLQPGCTHAQSTYKLHIDYAVKGAVYPVELIALNKVSIEKEKLAGVKPDPTYQLSADNVEVLQAWLAARYRRAAFPDALIERLRPMREKLSNIGKKSPNAIIGIWMSFDPDDDLSADTPYELWISIVYSTRIEGAETIAVEAAEKLMRDFEARFKTNDRWNLVELRHCKAYSETGFTILDLLRNNQWRLEHISMRQSPPGEIV